MRLLCSLAGLLRSLAGRQMKGLGKRQGGPWTSRGLMQLAPRATYVV